MIDTTHRFGTPFDELRADHSPAKLAIRATRDALYLGVGFPLGLAICCIVFTLAVTSLASAILVIGIPLAFLTLEVSRWAAELERGRARIADDRPVVARYRPRPRSANEVFASLADGRPWKDLAFSLLQAPLTFAAGLIAFVGWSVALGLALAPTYFWAFDGDELQLLGRDVDTLPEALLSMGIGLALIPVVFLICRVVAWASIAATRLVLGDGVGDSNGIGDTDSDSHGTGDTDSDSHGIGGADSDSNANAAAQQPAT